MKRENRKYLMLRAIFSILIFLIFTIITLPVLANGIDGEMKWKSTTTKCSNTDDCAPMPKSLCIKQHHCAKKSGQEKGVCYHYGIDCGPGAVCDGESGSCAMTLNNLNEGVCQIAIDICEAEYGEPDCDDSDKCTNDSYGMVWNPQTYMFEDGCKNIPISGCENCNQHSDCPNGKLCKIYKWVCEYPPLDEVIGGGNICQNSLDCFVSPWGPLCVDGFCQRCAPYDNPDNGCNSWVPTCNEDVWTQTLHDGHVIERPFFDCSL